MPKLAKPAKKGASRIIDLLKKTEKVTQDLREIVDGTSREMADLRVLYRTACERIAQLEEVLHGRHTATPQAGDYSSPTNSDATINVAQ